jgi:DNA-binding transcriptional MerR regulator
MTIGTLSRRSGVPVKTLRSYEDAGLIYTMGRSAGNYRLFDEEALWCVAVVSSLRSLGLTMAEIEDLTSRYLTHTGEPIGWDRLSRHANGRIWFRGWVKAKPPVKPHRPQRATTE